MPTKLTAVVTIASENYFAQVQTLLESLQRTNPAWDRYFAVVDEPDEDLHRALTATETCLIRMDEIGIPDLNDMKFRYDIMELNTAIKPFVLLKLLEKYERVVYLDPDICVYEEMTKVNEAFDHGFDFVVTPHFNGYFKDDGKHPDEPDIMRAGIYNFGFFAANNSIEAKNAIAWWAKKLETLCINRQKEGIFVDQKWMDLLPGRHANICILRDSGYNAAYWNLSHRKAAVSNGKFFFNGDPLVFFHFSGFNPLKRNAISKHQNRYSMNEIGPAKKLFADYADAVLSNGFAEWQKKPYSFGYFSDGRKIHNLFRILYRENTNIQKAVKRRNPFLCSDYFYDKKENLAPAIINYTISTHDDVGVFFINSRHDLWIRWFSDVLKNEYRLDKDWIEFAAAFFAHHLAGFTSKPISAPSALPTQSSRTDGVNLIGYIRSEHGVGEACRLTADALSTTDIEWNAYDWEVNNPSRKNDDTWDHKISSDILHNISIFQINADQLPVAREQLPDNAWKGYRIGVWYWELTQFPAQWLGAFDLVDEIWAPTKFIQENLQKVSKVPVLYMPPGIHRADPKPEFNRSYFGLPEDAFLFLNYFDALSYTSRKNPLAAIRAFQMSFAPDDMSVGLVLKMNNAAQDKKALRTLEQTLSGYKNIYILSKTMTRDEVNGLIFCCDAAVSLHRSEGLGLLCKEAMFYGKPVIATNWSGSTDFMTADSACLVDYTLVPIEEYYGTNEPNQCWADADIDHAASYMTRLRSDREYYEAVSSCAGNHIRTAFSPEVCGQRMAERIHEILAHRDEWDHCEPGTDPSQAVSAHEQDAINANRYWNVLYYRDLGRRSLKQIVKRVIRKLLGFLIRPMAEEQTIYNASTIRLVNELTGKVQALQTETETLKAKESQTREALCSATAAMNTLTESFTSAMGELSRTADVNAGLNEIRKGMADIHAEMTGISSGMIQLKDAEAQTADHFIQISGSQYNAMLQRVTSIDRTLAASGSDSTLALEKAIVENKWKLIDKYYREPAQMECSVCGDAVATAEAERLISEDIFGGGKLIRYRCPHCGAIIGPNKMWELSDEELAEEYRLHYRIHSEGETGNAEIETFLSLKPEKGKKYLNYGCGAWSSCIEELRSSGYDVYGFDPYAPCDSEFILTDFDELHKMKFDGIFSHDLLEHLRYPVEAFRLFNEILTDDGIMAHSTACYRYVYEYDRFHLVFYTGRAVEELCSCTGFVLTEKNENSDTLTFNYLYRKK